jgi:hypothetical protein
MINATSIATMKDGVRLINLSRADLVNALLAGCNLCERNGQLIREYLTENVQQRPQVIVPQLAQGICFFHGVFLNHYSSFLSLC